MKEINKIALMMRLNLVGEDLNNEETIGNIIQPRQMELPNGEIRQSISGEMLKHFHSKNLTLLADEEELCDDCKVFSPMRNGKVKEVDKKLSASGNKVKNCIVDDIEGFMNAKEGTKRTSVIKFSYAIATKENEVQHHLHTRVNNSELGGKKKSSENSDESGNSVQMIFHRPIRSNEYAITITVDLDRIGYDDEKLTYALDKEQIKNRQKKCIEAIRNMFLDIEGAMCSTRLPHLIGIEGVLVHKTNKDEVLSKYSALEDDYKERNLKTSSNAKVFNNIEEFVETLDEIVK